MAKENRVTLILNNKRLRKFGLAIGLISAIASFFILPRVLSNSLLNQKSYSRWITDRHDLPLRLTLSGDEKYRLRLGLSQMDPELIQAFLNKEDRWFYYHTGFNPISFTRAIFETYIAKSGRQGASTITMQTVRLLYPLNSKTVGGKFLQTLQALKLELLYSKKDILTAYLNWAPFGSNIEGVGAACLIYFEKTCQKLHPDEIEFLISLPQSPQRAEKKLIAEQKNKIPFLAPHFTDFLIQSGSYAPYTKTTLDLRLQMQIEKLAEQYLQSVRNLNIKNYSILVVNTLNNEILTYIGSADYSDDDIKGQIDATRTLRAPGSTLKPFIYALALQQGLIHEKTLLKDTKQSFAGFNPENFDEQFLGPLASDEALIKSRNLPAVALAQKLEKPSLYEFLKGKSTLPFKTEKYYGLSLALGGVEFTLQDITKLYLSLGNLGVYSDLNWSLEPNKSKKFKILTPESSYIVLQMLKKNPRIEGSLLDQYVKSSVPIAWKTGTSKSYKDAWTAGLVGNLVVAAWFGDNDVQSNSSLVGRNMAAPLFFQIADYLKADRYAAGYNVNYPRWDKIAGLNVKSVSICSVSKKIKTDNCQHRTEKALFIPSTSPIETCDIHQKILVNTQTHQRSCVESLSPKSEQIVEVWSEDILEIYEQAGMNKRTVPKFEKQCLLVSPQNTTQEKIVIFSPQSKIDYVLRMRGNKPETLKIPLKAFKSADAKYIDWFVDSRYLGRSIKDEVLFFETDQPGHHKVTLLDDVGRSQFTEIKIVVSQ